MASALSPRLKHNAELLVDGYFREFQDEFNEMIIPQGINNICFSFYFYAMDKFNKDLSASKMIISDDGFTATHDKSGVSAASAFGEQLIESLNNGSIYIWKFQLIKTTFFYAIGITSAYNERDENKDNTTFDSCKYSYQYNGYNGAVSRNIDGWEDDSNSQNGPVLEKDDIVEMAFDVGRGCLSYKINDKLVAIKVNKFNESGGDDVAFDDIEKGGGIKYRMAWSCVGREDSIKILSFEIQ